MAVRIRLKRGGRKNRPFYHIAACDVRRKRDGRMLEDLGTYDPLNKDDAKKVVLDRDRVRYWLDHGAQPSETVASILKQQGVSRTKPL